MNNTEIQIGHVLHCGWGYSMTFNEFYHVVGKRGKTIVILERLATKRLSGGGYTGDETVDLQAAPGARIEARLARGRKDAVKVEHGYAKVCDPNKSYYYNTVD